MSMVNDWRPVPSLYRCTNPKCRAVSKDYLHAGIWTDEGDKLLTFEVEQVEEQTGVRLASLRKRQQVEAIYQSLIDEWDIENMSDFSAGPAPGNLTMEPACCIRCQKATLEEVRWDETIGDYVVIPNGRLKHPPTVRDYVAYHEAGHVYIALMLDGEPTRVEIGDLPATEGRTRAALGRMTFFNSTWVASRIAQAVTREVARPYLLRANTRSALIALAGPVVTRMLRGALSGEDIESAESDFDSANRSISTIIGVLHPHADETASRVLVAEKWAEMECQLEKWLDTGWCAIVEIAQQLLKKSVLSGDDVAIIVDRLLPDEYLLPALNAAAMA